MNNFFEFIKNDIEGKKTLIASMPTKTITNKKKFNATIESIHDKYQEYLENTQKYLLAKRKAIKIPSRKLESGVLKENIERLEIVRFLINPCNTYFEKMGFDSLLYEIDNYYIFNFNSLNEIINSFLDKFEQAGIFLNNDDFDYTSYVHEYMSAFLEVRRSNSDSYQKVSQIFEQIYWENPDIIEHIELNFRKLIRKNEKKFNSYISKLQNEEKQKNNIDNYSICLERLKDAYLELAMVNGEEVDDIVDLALLGKIDIEQYLEGNKFRVQAYDTLVPTNVDVNDKKAMDKFCNALEKLKDNIVEYNNYLKFGDLFQDFKNTYQDLIGKEKTKGEKDYMTILNQINKKEDELAKINQKIYGGKRGLIERSEIKIKLLKTESVFVAKELAKLYKSYDEEYFKEMALSNSSKVMSVADLLNLYYSFDYFKKLAIQRVYKLDSYEEITSYSKDFDSFAKNLGNVVMAGVPIFEENNLPRVLSNKYRLNNIDLNENDFDSGNIGSLLNKILIVLRIKKLEEYNISVEKIWFVVMVDKLLKK